GIASASSSMRIFHSWSYADAHSRAAAAAGRAIQLDPELSEASTALGQIKTEEYAWSDAERAFRRAIALNPHDAPAHAHLGHSVLAPAGRFEEALREVRRALALDPLSPRTNGLALWTMFMAGQYKEAEDLARKQPRGSPGGPGLLARALAL